MDADIESRARRLRILALDVDGVLTDGRIHYSSDGEEMKSFSILDGLGIKLLRRAGLRVAVITARCSPVVERRVAELGIDHCLQGREDKLAALRDLLAEQGLGLAEAAYMGDDLPDLGAIRAAGLGLTVANGCAEVVAAARWQSRARGGEGAVREAC
jgi:3-deoxy-D-manno-octulosonate 8-phosphate phosphatase (KDO 8-P phosphatase)